MKPSEFKTTIKKFMVARENVLVVGSPGIGKSDICGQAASELVWDDGKPYDTMVINPPLEDPTNATGLPFDVKDKPYAEFKPFGNTYRMMTATRPLVVRLEDFGQTPHETQAAYMQILLAREINGRRISDLVRFIACTNRIEDQSGVISLLEAVKSRFITILNLYPDKDDWISWAVSNDMPVDIIAYIGGYKPETFNDWKPTVGMTNSPSPRTIANAGRILKMGHPENLLQEILTGTVGEACAIDIMTFRKVRLDLPSLDGIIVAPDTSLVPEHNPSAMYTIMAGLARKMTEQNIAPIMRYLKRIQRREFSTVCVTSAMSMKPELTQTSEFTAWAAENHALMH